MSMVWVDSQSLTDIADAIRSKNGESGTYLPSEMAGKINALQNNLDTSKVKWYSSDSVSIMNGRWITSGSNGSTGIQTSNPSNGITNTTYFYNPVGNATSFKVSIRFQRLQSGTSRAFAGNGAYNYTALPGFEVLNENKLGFGWGFSSDTSWQGWKTLSTVLSQNTSYIGQFEWTGTKIYCRLLDASGTLVEEWSGNQTSRPAANDSNAYYRLLQFSDYDKNSHYCKDKIMIDLFNTFIEKNGTLIWGCNWMGV